VDGGQPSSGLGKPRENREQKNNEGEEEMQEGWDREKNHRGQQRGQDDEGKPLKGTQPKTRGQKMGTSQR